MTRRFFWLMLGSLLLVALVLFSVLHEVSLQVTTYMTRVDTAHQQQLSHYMAPAELALQQGERKAEQLTLRIAEELSVWTAIRTAEGKLLSAYPLPVSLTESIGFQRRLDWPIHPFMTNVVIGLPLAGGASLMIELPEYMHPKPNTASVHQLLTLVLPSVVLLLFCWWLYRYLMKPLEALNQATLRFAAGDLTARVNSGISGRRRDEITQLISSFDAMAARIQRLVSSQRQLLGDLSHELRTPLTRLELAMSLSEQGEVEAREALSRSRREVEFMNALISDSLTLAWLDSDPVLKNEDAFNLATLLDLICDDAEFEYPQHSILRNYSDLPIANTNQQALAQSVENVLRNALKYAPAQHPIVVECLLIAEGQYQLSISDQGPGVDSSHLQQIFDPFFRTDKARSRTEGGFGLGLALVKRQVESLGGEVYAEVNHPHGLRVVFNLSSG